MGVDELREQFHLNSYYTRNIIYNRFKEREIHFGQPPILEFLNAHPDSSQKEIADYLDISPASVAVSVKRMEKSGLVMRVADKSDARRNSLRITEKGTELLSFAHDTFKGIDSAMTEGLDESELRVFTEILAKMNNNLNMLMLKREDKDV